jgi:hypothetical protein
VIGEVLGVWLKNSGCISGVVGRRVYLAKGTGIGDDSKQ